MVEGAGFEEAKEFLSQLKDVIKESGRVNGEDTLRLGQSGWKDRYYQQKFGINTRVSLSPVPFQIINARIITLSIVIKVTSTKL